jgi:hypothetical protein
MRFINYHYLCVQYKPVCHVSNILTCARPAGDPSVTVRAVRTLPPVHDTRPEDCMKTSRLSFQVISTLNSSRTPYFYLLFQ